MSLPAPLTPRAGVAFASLLAGAALAGGAGLLAAGGSHGSPHDTSAAPLHAPSAPVEADPTASPALDADDSWSGLENAETDASVVDDIQAPDYDLPVLEQVWLADQPPGTGPQIALRFVKAVQRRDDVAADRELYSFGRQMFAAEGIRALHQAMADVRRNAGLDHAAPCTRALRLSDEAAVVTCGRLRVVVHVLDDSMAHGVQIGDWWVHQDVYRGRHTHAFTTR